MSVFVGNNAGLNASGFRHRAPKSLLVGKYGGNYLIIPNKHNAASSYDDGSGVTKFEVWHSNQTNNAQGDMTWTRKAVITPTSAPVEPYRYSVDLYGDDSISLAWVGAAGIRHVKITRTPAIPSLNPTLTPGSEVAVRNNPANTTFQSLDVSVSDAGTVMVAAIATATAGSTRTQLNLFGLRSGQTVWENWGSKTLIENVETGQNASCVSCAWDNNVGYTVNGGRTPFCVVVGLTTAQQDYGFQAHFNSTFENVPLTLGNWVSVMDIGAGEMGSPPAAADPFRTWIKTAHVESDNTGGTGFICGMSILYSKATGKPAMYAVGWVYNGTTAIEYFYRTRSQSGYLPTNDYSHCAISISGRNDTGGICVSFLYNMRCATKYKIPVLYTCKFDPQQIKHQWAGRFNWDNQISPTTETVAVFASGGRWATKWSDNPTAFLREVKSGTTQVGAQLRFHSVEYWVPVITNWTPSDGAVVDTDLVPHTLTVKSSKVHPQTLYQAHWDFVADGGVGAGIYPVMDQWVNIAQLYTFSHRASADDGYFQNESWNGWGGIVDLFGNSTGTSLPAKTFAIRHPPAASNMTPRDGEIVVLTGTSGNLVTFTWDFTDSSAPDTQTAYRIQIFNSATNAQLYDSTKVVSTAKSATVDASAWLSTPLRWTLGLWDSDDVISTTNEQNSSQDFRIVTKPTITVSDPVGSSTVTTGVPSTTFTVGANDTRKIVAYRAVWRQQGSIVYDSGKVPISAVNNDVITHTAPKSYFKNNQAYSLSVSIFDEYGISVSTAPIPFSVAFVVPAAPAGVAVSTASFNSENAGGFVSITWDNSAIDVDFQAWVVYRRDDVIDPNTGLVIQQGELKEIGRVTLPQGTYQFKDYYAPSSYQTGYLVRQEVNRFNDEVESSNTTTVDVKPVSDGYWLLSTEVDNPIAVRLSIVTADDFTDEYEEAEFQIMGRGRYVERGDRLGVRGTLTAQIRDNEGMSARQKALKLKAVKTDNRKLYLRNPFGDIFRVSVGNLGISRVAGVGLSEFVDVTVPYAEVYDE